MANKSVFFEGTASRINIGANPTLNRSGWSITGWIKPILPQTTGMIYYNGDDSGGWGLCAGEINDGSGSKLVGLFGSIAWLSPSPVLTLTNNAWQFVAMTYDGTTVVFYFGSAAGEFTTGSVANGLPNTPTSDKGFIGAQPDGLRFFKGQIEELNVFNAALTATQIKDKYAGGLGRYGLPTDSNVIAIWHLDEGTGTTPADSSGNGYDGVFAGTPAPVWETGIVKDLQNRPGGDIRRTVVSAGGGISTNG